MSDYEQLVKSYPDTLILCLQGMFYIAYDESAYVLSVVSGYQVRRESEKSKCKCGFPKGSLDKVTKLLDEKHVNYIALKGSEVAAAGDFNSGNCFNDCLSSFNKNNIVTKGKKVKADIKLSEFGVDMDISKSTSESSDVIACSLTGIDQIDAFKKLEKFIQGRDVVALVFQGEHQEDKFVLKGKIEYA